jgi:SpoVK/Ycf46/Vps4 family AAA+-type ATPase
VPPPDEAARLQIIKLLAKDKPIAKLDDAVLALATEGFTGADMRWVFERAAELALADALHAGKTVPIHMDLLLSIIASHTPTTQDWMEGVKQHVPATSHDAISTEVRKFLQATAKKS